MINIKNDYCHCKNIKRFKLDLTDKKYKNLVKTIFSLTNQVYSVDKNKDGIHCIEALIIMMRSIDSSFMSGCDMNSVPIDTVFKRIHKYGRGI